MNKRSTWILVLICGVLLACTGKAGDKRKNNKTGQLFNQQQPGLVSEEQTEEVIVKQVISDYNIYDRILLAMQKIQFGTPGGDNWLVEWQYRDASHYTVLQLYVMKDRIVLKDYNLGLNYDMEAQSRYDIMKDIPGTHIGKGLSSIGDFNGDGIDEIFQYIFSGMGNFIFIQGYDADKNDKVPYCDIPFELIDPENGPAPVKFMSYKGMDGFKVYYFRTDVADGPNYVSEPDSGNKKWFFYTWDTNKREYVRVEEVVE
jgi:hypothetical protein